MGVDVDLEALLARAVELDEKAAGLDLGTSEEMPMRELIEEVKSEAAELRETLEALTSHDEGRLEPWEKDDEEQGLAELAALEAGLEGEPAPEPAAVEPPAAAEPVLEEAGAKAFDFDDLDGIDAIDALFAESKAAEDDLEVKAEDEGELSEMELLLARRAALGT